MANIELTKGYVAVVDDADAPLLSRYTWCVSGDTRYVVTTEQGKKIYMHRLLLGAPARSEVDHIDGNGLNNQRSNLRIADRYQQNRNTAKRVAGTSRFKGVSWDKARRMWRVQLYCGGKRVSERWPTEASAARRYNELAATYFGEWAWLNRIEPCSTH